MEPTLPTKTFNSIKAECSEHVLMVDRINTILVANEFFKSLPDKDRLNLIKQQMEKYDINLELLEKHHEYYSVWSFLHEYNTLWELIHELENKCKLDFTNKKLQILFK